MERVKKGEKYWKIGFYPWGIVVNDDIDTDDVYDRQFSAEGNRFHTKEEAEIMARKLSAVLKGAEVIKMPSDKEIEDAMKTSITESILCISPNGSFTPYATDLLECAWMKSAEWFKSKIIK